MDLQAPRGVPQPGSCRSAPEKPAEGRAGPRPAQARGGVGGIEEGALSGEWMLILRKFISCHSAGHPCARPCAETSRSVTVVSAITTATGGRCLRSNLVRAYLGAPPPHLRHGIASFQPQLLWKSDHSQCLRRALDVPRTVRVTGLARHTHTHPTPHTRKGTHTPLHSHSHPPSPSHPQLHTRPSWACGGPALPLLLLLLPVPAASRAPSMLCSQPHGARLGSLKPQPALTPTAKSSQRPINILIPVAS